MFQLSLLSTVFCLHFDYVTRFLESFTHEYNQSDDQVYVHPEKSGQFIQFLLIC